MADRSGLIFNHGGIMTAAPHHEATSDIERRGEWIQGFSGRKLHVLDLKPEDIDIRDIAHSLARTARFAGHTKGDRAYSVAQHCVYACDYVSDPRFRLAALLHDASEAYTGDVPRPLKRHLFIQLNGQMVPFPVIESRIDTAIHQRFGLDNDHETRAAVKAIDESLLVTEARDLMSPLHPDWSLEWLKNREPLDRVIVAWTADTAEDLFLARFYELTKSKD